MSPGGHLLTTAGACVGTAFATGDSALVAGIAAGGFLIDVDHAVDYVVFEGQRDLRPSVFLRYYLTGRVQRAVLVLHSYELFGLLLAVAWWVDHSALWGYLMGALLHLALDIMWNGELTPKSIAAFYSFGYRWKHGFHADALLGLRPGPVSPRFWTAFFRGAARNPLGGSEDVTRGEAGAAAPAGKRADREAF